MHDKKHEHEVHSASPFIDKDDSTDQELSDTGATGHFLVQNAHVVNKKPAKNPIKIKLPNRSIVMSTHTCNINIPELPDDVTEGHIVPELNASLVSSRKFCDAGYIVEYTKHDCIMYK